MSTTATVGAGIALIGALIALAFLPSRAGVQPRARGLEPVPAAA